MTDDVRHFVICGAQRSATTFLMQMLDSHPAIDMAKPFRPEPKVFLQPDYQNLSLEHYRELFFAGRSEDVKWLGEKSTSYYENAKIPARLANFFDKPKLIFVLRDPVHRAISNYHFSHMHGYEAADINTALLREIENPDDVMSSRQSGVSVSPQAYLARGNYVEFLRPFYVIFPSSDILLLKSEELIREDEEQARLYHFLEVAAPDHREFSKPVNESRKDSRQILSSDTKAKLIDYFSGPNAQLSNEFGFDISGWK